MRGISVLFWVLIVIVIVVGAIGFFNTLQQCDAQGGVLVRGAFGYVCAAGPNAR